MLNDTRRTTIFFHCLSRSARQTNSKKAQKTLRLASQRCCYYNIVLFFAAAATDDDDDVYVQYIYIYYICGSARNTRSIYTRLTIKWHRFLLILFMFRSSLRSLDYYKNEGPVSLLLLFSFSFFRGLILATKIRKWNQKKEKKKEESSVDKPTEIAQNRAWGNGTRRKEKEKKKCGEERDRQGAYI